MTKKGFRIQDLIDRDVIRPNLPQEWLTKISFREFNRWARAEADIIRFRGGTSREAVALHIESEIQQQEKMYQLLKSLGNNGLKKNNDVVKWQNEKTFDLVATPSTRKAVLDLKDCYKPMTATTTNMYYDPKSLYGEKFVYENDYKEKYLKHSF